MAEAIFYITEKSGILANKIKGLYPDATVLRYRPGIVKDLWDNSRLLIFIMAAGIVVRSIASLIRDKKSDPAVLVLDEEGNFVISLLSGHIGGANSYALEIADFLSAQAVITTASDVSKLTAIDLWARDNNLAVENGDMLPFISTRLINNRILNVYDEAGLKLPDEFVKVETPDNADLLITNKINPYNDGRKRDISRQLYLRPKNIAIGIGCNSGTAAEEIEAFIQEVLLRNNLSFLSISILATISKKASEPGLIRFSQKYGFKIKTFTPDEINLVEGVRESKIVIEATGAKAVAEPAAILASRYGSLLVEKQKKGNVTVAAAEMGADKEKHFSEDDPKLSNPECRKRGRIYIVGTGPGNIENITPYAQKAIKASDFIVGYGTYLDLIPEFLKGKKTVSTGMTQEIDRCKKAIELANEGKTVSVISGGDPGIYAMAGLVFELLKEQEALVQTGCKADSPELKTLFQESCRPHIEVIPGISALNACASRLGAPLMHDFASISLSDRLTPWEVITKRLDAAASSDFVIVLYNPKSKGRVEHINMAVSIIQKYRSPETPAGLVRQAMREGETVIITDLQHLLEYDIDMQTTIIIGNSQTFIWDGWIVTPRGYRVK